MTEAKARETRGNPTTRVGKVVSYKMNRSVVVRVDRIVNDKLYKRYVRCKANFMAHDENNVCKIGDTVEIVGLADQPRKVVVTQVETFSQILDSGQAGDNVVISNQEFPSNRIVWESLQALGVELVTVNIDSAADPEGQLIDAITARTRLLSVSSVQYATGLALDLEPIGAACRQRGVAFCVDAIQGLGVKPFDVEACQADFVMADGHKWMLGAEGLALFYCRREWIERLSLRQYGWHMVEAMGDYDRSDWQPAASARRFECGSPNMLGIHALNASMDLLLQVGIQSIFDSVSDKVQYLIDNIINYGGVILSRREPERRAGIVTFRFDGEDIKARYRHLQENGVICALRGGGIRFSPHFYTPEAVLQRALALSCEPLADK